MKKIIYIFIILTVTLISIPDHVYNPAAITETIKENFQPQPEKEKIEFPAIIIMYDDGHIQDYTEAFPIHQKYNIPGVSAVNPGTLGKINRLDTGHLIIMEQNGWEIANHGHYHAALIYNSVTQTPKKGDDRLYVNNSYLVEPNYNYTLFNTKTNFEEIIEIDKITTDNEGNQYLKLDNPLSRDYPLNQTYIMLTKEAMNNEIVTSNEMLTKLNIDVETFVYPYNGYIKPAVNIVKENYQLARGGRRMGESFPEAFINTKPLDKYFLKGVSFENHLLPADKLEILLEKVVEKEGLLIMYAHTNHKNFKTDRLIKIIEKGKKLDIEFITFSDLL